jgi:hypothetical protein
MPHWFNAINAKSLLIWVGGVLATIIGSWISSKFRVYDDSRKTHLDEIKQKVLIPIRDGLREQYSPLVTNQAPVVFEKWGMRHMKENVSVTEYPKEDGPSLQKTIPNILASTDQAFFVDARQRHFRELIEQVEQFMAAWEAFATECYEWAQRLSEEILAGAKLPESPVKFGSSYIMHYRLGVFVYRRLFRSTDFALHLLEPTDWIRDTPSSGWRIEGFDGQPAQGTKQEMLALLALLDSLSTKEKDTAKRLLEGSRELEKRLASVNAQLTNAIAARRLHKGCDLVPFFQ